MYEHAGHNSHIGAAIAAASRLGRLSDPHSRQMEEQCIPPIQKDTPG